MTRLAEALASLRGRFLMSINDVPEIRALFGAFNLTEVATTYTIGTKNDSRAKRAELLISNFEWNVKGMGEVIQIDEPPNLGEPTGLAHQSGSGTRARPCMREENQTGSTMAEPIRNSTPSAMAGRGRRLRVLRGPRIRLEMRSTGIANQNPSFERIRAPSSCAPTIAGAFDQISAAAFMLAVPSG